MKAALIFCLALVASASHAASATQDIKPLVHSCEGLDSIANQSIEGDKAATKYAFLKNGKMVMMAPVVSPGKDQALHLLVFVENAQQKMTCFAVSGANGVGFTEIYTETMSLSMNADGQSLSLQVDADTFTDHEGMTDDSDTIKSTLKLEVSSGTGSPQVIAK